MAVAFKIESKGGLQALASLSKKLNTADEALKAGSKSAAEEAINLIKDGFRTERSPYGKRWKKKQVPDGRKTLSGPTSRLKGGWHRARATKRGFAVSASVVYYTYHQKGTKHLVPRRMTPERSMGLPRKWSRAFDRAYRDAIRRHLRS